MLKSNSLAVILMLSLAVCDSAISSDCARASTKTEKLICGSDDNGLKWLDDTLNSEYKRALARTDNPEVFRSNQRMWLKAMRDTCTDTMCLGRVYVDRIAQISRSSDDIEGVYLTNGDCMSEPWRDKNGESIGKECRPAPINHLKIEKISEGKYRVTSEVHQFANGNFTCSADANMLRRGDALHLSNWVDAEGLDSQCPFAIRIRPSRFEITTNGEQCGLCGQNGSFDGEVFPRKSNAK